MTTYVEGATITFAIESDEDLPELKKWIRVSVRFGDTVRRIAARRGHPEAVKAIMKKNKIRNGRRVLRRKKRPAGMTDKKWKALKKKNRKTILVPGNLKEGLQLTVLAGDEPPTPTTGYAKFDTVDRPDRVGLTRFRGYDPFTLEVPIRFEAWTKQGGREQGEEGKVIEEEILLLERMAGRGDSYRGAGLGPPPVIRLSSTFGGPNAPFNKLVSSMFQYTEQSNAPLWRIAGISWDDGALRSKTGNRLRQTATVTLQQHTRLRLQHRSATRRAADKPQPLTEAQKRARRRRRRRRAQNN